MRTLVSAFASKAKNQKGFSLVELMVVVAIIGILAAVAVPSINKYMSKARQSEAKANLAALYTAEKAFFSEYNFSHTSFSLFGYRPEGNMRYNVGFGVASNNNTAAAVNGLGFTGAAANVAGANDARTFCAIAGTNCRLNAAASATASIASVAAYNCRLSGLAIPNAGGAVTNVIASADPAIGTAALGFRACAGASISTNPNADGWSISDSKELINVQDGT